MNIAIIGAGITGLTAALDLVKAGHRVTIFEANTYIGGLASGFKEPGWEWSLERFYHHWFLSDKTIKALLRELGLSRKLVVVSPQTVAYYHDRFYPLDSPRAVLTFPGLSLTGKFRFALVTAYLKFLARWQPLEAVTAEAWCRRYYGREVYEVIWQPLMEGKFLAYAPVVNMAWLWARLKARTARLATYEGGFQAFIDDFVRYLKGRGVVIKTTTPVREVTPGKKGVTLTIGPDRHIFDRCLITGSPALAQKLVPALPKQYLKRLLELKSLGAVEVIFSLKRPLSPEGYYWYNLPKNQGFPFLALVEHTNFVPAGHFGGDHLLYCADYCDPADRRLRMPKQELIAAFLPVLRRINPRFKPSWVKKSWVHRTPYAQPVPFLNHSVVVPALKTPLPHLYFAGMSHVYPWDRGTNYAAALGRRVAALMVKDDER